jgi:RHS repeat-associated protein
MDRLHSEVGIIRSWYTADALGSVRVISSNSGTPSAVANYDPYGGLQGSAIGSFGFTGELQQGSSVYLRARWYNATNSTFTSRDPWMGDPQRPASLLPYLYTANSPINRTDPSGLDWLDDVQRGATWVNDRVGLGAAQDSVAFFQQVGYNVRNNPGLLRAVLCDPAFLDDVQFGLDTGGLIPILGVPIDIANAGISAWRGQYADAALRAAFALPGIGDYAGGAHLVGIAGRRALRGGEELAVRSVDDVAEGAGHVVQCVAQNSFDADTPVQTPDGERPISEIRVGDTVFAYHEATGETGPYTVTHLISHTDPLHIALTIDGEQIDTTPEHPFFVLLRGWVDAAEVRVSDYVRRIDGSYGKVEASRVVPGTVRMYNLTVAEAHTFFVGEEGWLVHNEDPCDAIYHYTNRKGADAIRASRVIKSNWRNQVFVTPDKLSPFDAFYALFAGNPLFAGKGDYVVVFRIRPEVSLGYGTQPNEWIHIGSLRDGKHIDIFDIRKNNFDDIP